MTKPTVAVDDMENTLRTARKRYRGRSYVITELPYVDYQKTVKMATTTDPETKEEVFDGDAHNAILLSRCLRVDGQKVDVDALYASGTALVGRLIRDVREVLFGEEKDEPEDDGPGEVETTSSSPTES